MATPRRMRTALSCGLALALALGLPGVPAHADSSISSGSSSSSDTANSTSSASSASTSTGSSGSGDTAAADQARADYDTSLHMWRFYFRNGGFHDNNTAEECLLVRQDREHVDGSATPPAPTCTNEVADTLLMLALSPIKAFSSEFTLFSLLHLFFPGR